MVVVSMQKRMIQNYFPILMKKKKRSQDAFNAIIRNRALDVIKDTFVEIVELFHKT